MPTTRSIGAALRNYCRAKGELSKGPGPNNMQAERLRTLRNTKNMLDSESPIEVRHCLTDYRNNNDIVCTKIMNRKLAHEFNKRLADSGFAWAVKTGY